MLWVKGSINDLAEDQRDTNSPWRVQMHRSALSETRWSCGVARYFISVGNSNFDLKESGILKVTVGYRVAESLETHTYESINAGGFRYLVLDLAQSLTVQIISLALLSASLVF